MKKIRKLQIITATIIILVIALLFFTIQPSLYEAILHVLATPTVVYILLTVFKPVFSKKLQQQKTKYGQLLQFEKQRKTNRANGLKVFLIEGHEIWALNYPRAMQTYHKKIKPIEEMNKGKLYYYMNQKINNL